MKKLLFFLSFFILSFHLFSQNRADNTWVFGYSQKLAGVGDTCFGGNFITFNQKNIVSSPVRINMSGTMEIVNSSYSNSKTGELLFYTNGCFILNKYHQIMKNSDSLNFGGLSFTYACPLFGGFESQNHIILPFLDGSNKYALFHDTRINETWLDTSWLNLTIVDMDKDNGKGEVIQKQKPILGVRTQNDHLSAIKHGNGRDWWLLFRKEDDNVFYRLLFTPKGVEKILTQTIGPKQADSGGGGQTLFTPDGRKFIAYDPTNGISVFDFDRCTGLLSNQIIMQTYNKTGLEAGCEVSPNSRFLYITKLTELWQYDLKSENIDKSKILVDSLPNKGNFFASTAFRCQLAPDNKIYICSAGGHKILHTIHNPNEKGKKCDFRRGDFHLLTYSYASIPYFPRYRMGAWLDSPCDTLGIAGEKDSLSKDFDFKVYPTLVTNTINFELQGDKKEWLFRLYNVLGQEIYRKNVNANILYEYDTENLQSGSYFWILSEGNRKLNGKIVKVNE
jgi:hypothetical protein